MNGECSIKLCRNVKMCSRNKEKKSAINTCKWAHLLKMSSRSRSGYVGQAKDEKGTT